MAIFHGKIHYKWQCSIAMLNYQRVFFKMAWVENKSLFWYGLIPQTVCWSIANLRLTDSESSDQKPLLPRASEWYMCGSMLHRTGKIWLLQHAILSWWLVVMMMMIHINVMSSPGCHEFSSLFHSNCTLGCDVVLNEPHWTCTPVAKWNWIVTSNQFQLEINCFIKTFIVACVWDDWDVHLRC